MKRLFLVSFLAGLMGCAAVSPESTAPFDRVDYDRMALVERAAQHAGVQVIWIRPPLKAAAAGGDG